MKVLITGASGFIGMHLILNLSRLGVEVLAIARSISNHKNISKIKWIKADLSQKSSYQNKVKKFSPEVVIHLAWQDIPDFTYKKSILNLDQSLEFVNYVASLNSCKKIIFSGSCLEYDYFNGICYESALTKGSKSYFAMSKNVLSKKAEIICKKNAISFAWFRIFYVYGPGQRAESLLPSILSKLKKNKLPAITSPFNSNDYIYIDDVVDAFVKSIFSDFVSGIFNLGSGHSTSVIQVCRQAEKIVLNSSHLSDELEANGKHNESDVNFWASIKKTNNSFNWKPKVNLIDGIKKTWMSIN